MRTRTIIAVTLVAAAGLVGCFPRHGGHHGPWGNNGWNNAGWSGNWSGPGWGDNDWDDDDDWGDRDDHWDDDDHWNAPCHPANNFCGNNKPWW